MPERLMTPFLARRAYRLRRMMDAARLVPVLGALAVILPVFHAGHHPQHPMWFGRGLALMLGVWLVMVLAAAVIGRVLAPAIGATEDPVGSDEPALATAIWPPDPGATSAIGHHPARDGSAADPGPDHPTAGPRDAV
ncbi:hypothetical protein ACEYYB_09110 [Paracoccus sp. p4-l81]|uniref:hypothetical protein n=1 Tax=Paracoccus sp. p4-l81 TaxID=3342806 RepID=UPI0035B883A4